MKRASTLTPRSFDSEQTLTKEDHENLVNSYDELADKYENALHEKMELVSSIKMLSDQYDQLKREKKAIEARKR